MTRHWLARLLLVALGVALLAGCGDGPTSGSQGGAQPGGRRSQAVSAAPEDGSGVDQQVRLLQMNLCLSGIALCVAGTQAAETVSEAAMLIRQVAPDVVVLNEACSRDAARLASAGHLHLTFSRVAYLGTTLPCRHPAGRGAFGNAVLTAERPTAVHDQAFGVQDAIEERRVVCVRTRLLRVCGTHLNVRGSGLAGTNDAQCLELGEILTSLSPDLPTVISGDMNRRESCAPPGWWTLTDEAGRRHAGLQQAYGDPRVTSPTAVVEPMVHTDHDALVVRFRVPAPSTG